MTTRIALGTRAATSYGPHEIDDKNASHYQNSAGQEVMTVTFSFDDLPVDSTDSIHQSIPANSYIDRATLRVITAFAGGTSYNIGLTESDGTAIDADGIDAAIALTAIDAIGETVLCNGALVQGLAGIGTAAGQIDIVATGTFTAGKASLEIVYQPLTDRA